MKRKLKKFFLISGITLTSLVVVLVISFLFIYFNKSFVKNYLEKTIAKSGIQLSIGKLDYSLFPLNVQADSVKVFQEIGGMEVDVSFDELNLKGQLGRLIRKKRPSLEFLNVKGATFRVFIKEVAEEEIDYQMYMRQISDLLSNLEELNLENFSIQYITPTNSATLEGCGFVLSDSETEGEYVYSLSSEKIGVDSPSHALMLETSFRSSGKFSFLEQPYFEGDMMLRPSKFEFRNETLQLPEIALKMKGEFPLDKKIMIFPQLELSIPSLLDASVSLNLDMSEVSSVVSSARIYLRDLMKAYALFAPYLKPYIPPQIESFAVEGSVYLEGEYKSISTPSEKKTDLKGMVRIDPTQIRCETPAFAFGSGISGEFKVSGVLPDLRLSGSLDIKEGSLSRDDLSIQEVTLGLSLEGTSASVEVSRLIGSLKGLSFVSEDKKVELDKVGFDGQGRIDITGKKANLDRLEFQFPPLAPIEINAFVDLQPQGEKSVRLKSTKLDSSELLNLFSSFIPGSVLDL
ncbi:hypothetical protein GH140_06585, partial [bacterium]|nr:hypothetical protein [bacterium]